MNGAIELVLIKNGISPYLSLSEFMAREAHKRTLSSRVWEKEFEIGRLKSGLEDLKKTNEALWRNRIFEISLKENELRRAMTELNEYELPSYYGSAISGGICPSLPLVSIKYNTVGSETPGYWYNRHSTAMSYGIGGSPCGSYDPRNMYRDALTLDTLLR